MIFPSLSINDMIELKFISKSHTGTELVINNARVAIQKVGQDSMLYRLILNGNAIFWMGNIRLEKYLKATYGFIP